MKLSLGRLVVLFLIGCSLSSCDPAVPVPVGELTATRVSPVSGVVGQEFSVSLEIDFSKDIDLYESSGGALITQATTGTCDPDALIHVREGSVTGLCVGAVGAMASGRLDQVRIALNGLVETTSYFVLPGSKLRGADGGVFSAAQETITTFITRAGACHGTPTACVGLNASSAICRAQTGCSYTAAVPATACLTTRSACTSQTTGAACFAVAGCAWDSPFISCGGSPAYRCCNTPFYCTETTSTACDRKAPLCSWHTYLGTCSGSPSTCTTFRSASACVAQAGCSW